MLHNSALTHRYMLHKKGHLHKCTWVLHTLTHTYATVLDFGAKMGI